MFIRNPGGEGGEMKAFLKSFLGSLLAILVVVLVVAGVVASKVKEKPKVEDGSYLVVDLYGDLLEYDPPSGMLGMVSGKAATLTQLLENFEKAAVDDRVTGVILKLSSSNSAGMGKIQELRAGVAKIQAAGKKVYGFADTMSPRTYQLAVACDSLFMPPSAYINFAGMQFRSMFVKNTLAKLGIHPNVHQIKDYKAAAEMVTRTDMSAAARENREWLADEIWAQAMTTIREDRGLSEEQVIAIMEMATITAEQALEHGLVDALLYWDEFEARLRGDEEKLRTVCECDYSKLGRNDVGLKGKKKIAVVHAQGMIGGRHNGTHPMFGITMGHETINAAIREAREDKDVAAIVFRVDSGGGESLASDLMSREVWITRDEKPIVSSMVDIAGSGGYYIAYTATKIMANPLTATGSIGSISMKFNMAGLYEKLGLSYDQVTRGPMARFWDDTRDFTEEEWKRFSENHWDGFNMWLRDVADKRGMEFEDAERLAHGRVWTGSQAKENGLIDELGSYYDAVALAKELAGIEADEEVTIEHYPKGKGLVESLMGGGIAAATDWVVYDFIRGKAQETYNLMTGGGQALLREELLFD
jgi:protease IV